MTAFLELRDETVRHNGSWQPDVACSGSSVETGIGSPR